MMTDEDVYRYVRESLASGYPRDSIKKELASRGYDSVIVDRIADGIRSRSLSKYKQKPLETDRTFFEKMKDNALVLEFVALGAVIVVAAYVFIVGV